MAPTRVLFQGGAWVAPSPSTAPGASWGATAEWLAGVRTSPSAAWLSTASWAPGKGAIEGIGPGAALNVTAAWTSGAASVPIQLAPGATWAPTVAWSGGAGTLQGGTAPGAAWSVSAGWIGGIAQSAAPGAAFAVSATWVGGAASGGNDPNFANVSLLLPLDGADGSTTFTDASSNGFTLTRFGTAAISTSGPKYGTGSLSLTTSGSYIQTPASSVFAFGTGDLTVECDSLIGISGSTNMGLFTFGQLALAAYDGNWWLTTTGSGGVQMGGVPQVNTWAHVAVTRAGGSLRLFINGSQVGNTLSNSTNLTGNTCSIGMYFDSPYSWFGKIDNFRVTKGVARYTSSFTPPSGPHPTY